MSEAWLVVGLGNLGTRYARNRHNVGHMVIDVLAGRAGSRLSKHRTRARVAEVRLGMLPGGAPGPRAILAESAGYMNVSGGPVKALVRFYGVDPATRLLVIHDELDLPAHELRLKRGGGEGGHNGLRDITKALGTKDYYRVRTGIGRPPGRMDTADFVLKPFSSTEAKDLPFLISNAADATMMLVKEGLLATQQRYHGAGS